MRKILLIFALTAPCTIAAGGGGQRQVGADPKVAQFAVSKVSAIQALLKLSHDEHLPMGIVMDDDTLCTSMVSYSATNIRASAVIKGIVAEVPGHVWKRSADSAVFLVTPASPRAVTNQFLALVDDQFGPAKDTLQGLEVALWVHIRYILYPDQGTAGSILTSTNPRVYQLEAKDASVQQLLDQMAQLTKGAWVLRPLPATLANLSGDLPFSIFSDDGQGDQSSVESCVPVRGENQR
jgi:hypothetical protein